VSVRSRPFPVVIAAPSGTGKSTLARALVARDPQAVFSVSATTRPPRGYETDGVDYEFVDAAEFARMIDGGELLEWAEVHGHRYGTPVRAVTAAVDRGETVVLDIDVQGARQIRERIPDAVLVFVIPPSGAELVRRLRSRASESEDERRRRLHDARAELHAAADFDYVVVNDDLERAVEALQSIVEAERRRYSRLIEPAAVLERIDAEVTEILERSR
jgi:guanylate kinase